jgi:hypothetical protein
MSRDNSYASSQGDEFDPDEFEPKIFIHVTPKADACKHDFQGWRAFDDGHGGEQICTKCGLGAMSYTLSLGDLP